MSSTAFSSGAKGAGSGSSDSSLPVVVAGAGLAGCMSGLLLAQQYHKHGINQKIIILENREDFRIEDRQDAENGRMGNAVKRSINLALSYRGMCALRAAGLSATSGDIIPMASRLMHDLTGHITAQPYGVGEQAIYSISRRGLNEMLLNEIDKLGAEKIEVRYGCKVAGVKQDGTISYTTTDRLTHSTSTHTLQSRFVLGADGAYSKIRDDMRRYTRMDFSMTYIKHGYKELTIAPSIDAKTGETSYALAPWQGLHIWPRDQFMLIALPNPDKSFTCTLFFPLEGADSLEAVEAGSDEGVIEYFKQYFPDVLPVMPDLVSQFRESPNSALLQIKCDPYHAPGSRVAILGDAAHACVPFYGQGMNAAFEDCLLLSEIMDECGMDTNRALPEFTRQRVAAGQALVDLSFENYIEMRHHTASSMFLLRKKVEAVFARISSAWIPQYTMVAFTRIPYDEALRRARKQDKIIERLATLSIIGIIGAAAVGVAAVVRANFPNVMPNVNCSVTWPKASKLK